MSRQHGIASAARLGASAVIYRVATALNERLSAYWRGQPDQLLVFLNHQQTRAIANAAALVPMDVGFRTYSQSDEDGILLAVFAAVGMGGRRCVDIGSGRPMGANSTNLLVNWHWSGFCVDADPEDIAAACQWFARNRTTMFAPPTTRVMVVTAENVNDALASAGFAEELDLLSIDIDGQDYWVWQSLASRPRVVVVEFNSAWDSGESVTVPRSDSLTTASDLAASFAGASLEALVRLGAERGYRLVAVSNLGSNAVFVRADLAGADQLRSLSTAEALSQPNVVKRRVAYSAVRKMGWVEV
jgi:hypothetical protein